MESLSKVKEQIAHSAPVYNKTKVTQRPPPPDELLQFHPAYSVLICNACRYAIQPTGIARHVKEIHHIYRSHRRPYIQYASHFELADPQDVIQAEVTEFPVGLLPTLDGLQCLGAEDCGHLCVSLKRMQKHWLSVHGRHGDARNDDWRPAPLQTFFRGNLLHYFTSPQMRAIPRVRKQTATQNTHFTDILGRLDELDQKLFHHYLTSTSLTLVDVHGTQDTWQRTIPQMARDSPFLMHAMMACSALHLAHQFPSDIVYLTRSHEHQDLAMSLFRQAIANVTKDNCHSIIAFSHLLVIYSFASGCADDRMLLIDTSSQNPGLLCSWLYFVRNVCLIVCDFWRNVQTGPLGSLTSVWELAIPDLGGSSRSGIKDHLLSLLQIEQDQKALEIYSEAAEQLGSAIEAAQALNGREGGFTTWDVVRVWPLQISAAYIELLTRERPVALMLLAHYCLVLRMVEPRWYLEDLAEGLLNMVLGRLDPEYRRCILQSFKQMEEFLPLPYRASERFSASV